MFLEDFQFVPFRFVRWGFRSQIPKLRAIFHCSEIQALNPKPQALNPIKPTKVPVLMSSHNLNSLKPGGLIRGLGTKLHKGGCIGDYIGFLLWGLLIKGLLY